jgi:hypothetical protein
VKKQVITIVVALGALMLVWALFFLSGSEGPPTGKAPLETPEPTPEEAAEPTAAPDPAAPDVEPAPAAPPVRRIPGEQAAADAQDRPEKIGPVEELKAAYQSDARDPEAGATEERIRGHLKQDEIPAELVRRVSCVKSVCKIEVSWTSDRRHGYMIAMMSLISHVGQQVAAEPLAEPDGQQVHPVDIYVSRLVPPYTPPASK